MTDPDLVAAATSGDPASRLALVLAMAAHAPPVPDGYVGSGDSEAPSRPDLSDYVPETDPAFHGLMAAWLLDPSYDHPFAGCLRDAPDQAAGATIAIYGAGDDSENDRMHLFHVLTDPTRTIPTTTVECAVGAVRLEAAVNAYGDAMVLYAEQSMVDRIADWSLLWAGTIIDRAAGYEVSHETRQMLTSRLVADGVGDPEAVAEAITIELPDYLAILRRCSP